MAQRLRGTRANVFVGMVAQGRQRRNSASCARVGERKDVLVDVVTRANGCDGRVYDGLDSLAFAVATHEMVDKRMGHRQCLRGGRVAALRELKQPLHRRDGGASDLRERNDGLVAACGGLGRILGDAEEGVSSRGCLRRADRAHHLGGSNLV